MTQHTSHQMQLTSLYCYFPSWNEQEFNQKFRQETECKIMQYHQAHPEGLTDEELLKLFGNPDTNLVRPRRCDLSRERNGKRTTRPCLLVDSGETRTNKYGRQCIVWKINPEKLAAYMER